MGAGNLFSIHVSIAWLDHYWIFSGDREKLKCKVNDVIEELMDFDVEPNQNPCGGRRVRTLAVGRQRHKLGDAVRGGV